MYLVFGFQVKFNCKRGDYDVFSFAVRVQGTKGKQRRSMEFTC